MSGPESFMLLNEAASLAECGWDDSRRTLLWRYNLHYFDDLNARDAAERRDWHEALIGRWIAENPPAAGTGWAPYPASLRIVNWIKWAQGGGTLDPPALQSLAVQCRWLRQSIEWHLLGNHLIANAKALVFAGLFFDGTEARAWRDMGFAILAEQTGEQILEDGGQFELSPMYHALAIEDWLDLINIARRHGAALTAAQEDQAARWRARVPAMLRWLAAMSHPDGKIAFFNDAAFGIAPETHELRRYANELDIADPRLADSPAHLAASGYARLDNGVAAVIADMAPVGPDYLPAHAHADTLSFEMSLHGRRLIVNGGTSTYGDGPGRQRQRATAAHSTLVVAGDDSSEVWAGFRVGRRAHVSEAKCGRDGAAHHASAVHDGYRHVRGSPRHRRTWRLEPNRLAIEDGIEGHGTVEAEIRFHLPPEVQAHEVGGGFALVDRASGAQLATFDAASAGGTVQPSRWHPEFGVSLETSQIVIPLSGAMPLRHTTIIEWAAA